MPARGTKWSAALDRWSRAATRDERRTVILRCSGATDMARAREQLLQLGVEIESAGPGVIVTVVTPAQFPSLGDLSWITALEAPRQLELSTQPGTR
jgi:hypothetical protein